MPATIACARGEQDLLDGDDVHVRRRHDAVLDLARAAELGRQRQRDRGDALEEHGDRDEAGDEHGGEPCIAGSSCADRLADAGEDEREHEDEQQRLHERAGEELGPVAAQDAQVAQREAVHHAGDARWRRDGRLGRRSGRTRGADITHGGPSRSAR
jgi:hypothetical protein